MAGENDISGKVGLDYADFQRGITALNQQLKNIEVSFRGSAATMDDWSGTSEGLGLRISTLNEKLDLQKTKLKALTDEFNLLNNSEGDHTKEQQQLAGQMAALEKQINSTQSEIKKYSTSLDDLEGNADEAGTEVKNLGDDFDDAGKKALSFGDVLKANVIGDAIVDGIKAVGGAVKDLASDALESADSLQQMSDETGLSTERLQELKYAGDDLGVGLDTISGAQAKLTKAMSAAKDGAGEAGKVFEAVGLDVSELGSGVYSIEELRKEYEKLVSSAMEGSGDERFAAQNALDSLGISFLDLQQKDPDKLFDAFVDGAEKAATATNTQADAFKALGISVTDNNGNLRDAKEVMLEAFDALESVGNETERDALAMSIFGKSAQDLNPLIKAGSEGMNDLAQQARDAGAVMSDETIQALDAFGDTTDHLKQSAAAMAGTLLEQLLPSIQPIIDSLKNMDVTPIANFLSFVLSNSGTIAAGIASIGAGFAAFQIVNTITGLVGAFQAFRAAQEGVTIAQAALNLVMNANPLGIIIAAVAALAAALVVLWSTNDGFRDAVTAAWEAIKTTAEDVFGAVANFFTVQIPAAFQATIDFIQKNWQALLLFIANPIAGAIKLLYDLNPKFREWADGVGDAVKAGLESAIKWITSMPSEALQWGKDIILGIVKGIKAAASAVGDAVKGIAQNIRSYLHFSVPDVGPLADYESWMPDFMQGLANGITANESKVTNAMASLSGRMAATSPINITASGSAGGYGFATTNLYLDSKQVVSATSPVQYSVTNTKARSYGVVLA